MAATREEILDVQGRAIELVASIDDERAREAVRLMSEVGFVLAMQERDTDTGMDDGYDADWLTEQDADDDRIAEVVALGDLPPFHRGPFFQPREYDRD